MATRDDSDERTRRDEPLRASWDPIGERVDRGPRPDRGVRRRTRLGGFVATYGWRAYALPVLLVVTVIVVWDAVRGDVAADAPPVAASDPSATSAVAPTSTPPTIAPGELPDGPAFTVSGAGTWHVVPGTTPQVGAGQNRVFTYTVEIEDGVDTAGVGGDEAVAREVDTILADPRSWTQDPGIAFRRVDASSTPDFRVSLTSQMTIRQGCGFDIPLEASCYNPGWDRVLLGDPRWVRGAVAADGDLDAYRRYLVNHEVGHAIGLAQHDPCPEDGAPAPIMMQQSFGVGNDDIARVDPHGPVPADGKVCRFNPWPHP